MAKFLRILGISLTIIFSLGAIIGANDHHVRCSGEQGE